MSDATKTDMLNLCRLLDSYCPDSINCGEVKPINPGHPIHDAIVKLQTKLPDRRLPPNARSHWRELLRYSRAGDGRAFDAADRLASWARRYTTLTDSEHLCLQAVEKLSERGISPIRDTHVAEYAGFKTNDAVRRHLASLVNKGWLKSSKRDGYIVSSL